MTRLIGGLAMAARLGPFLILAFLAMAACSSTTGSSIELKRTIPVDTNDQSGEVAVDENQLAPETDSKNTTISVRETGEFTVRPNTTETDPRLGFVIEGDAVAIANGGRVPLGEGKLAEVFLAPYPPDWQTDLHLYLLNGGDFSPITDVEVDLVYEMTYMDHGIDKLAGTQVGDGHYVLPLSFVMYGDWNVDTIVDLPKEGKKRLRFVVKFHP